MSETPKFGDLVEYDLTASHGGKPERAYMIGVPDYASERDQVIMLAADAWVGMPIWAGHCKVISSGHEALCRSLHDRYANMFPGKIKALEGGHG